ncbi:MAG: hypothetical protein RL007_515 [Bacteroidota bacterium]|jgi:uncharacterized protein (DUF2147 family)
MIRYIILFLFVSQAATTNWVANDITGIWWNKDKDAKIKIYSSYSKYYGQIHWLKNPIDSVTNKPKLDKNNPKKEEQKRPIQGLLILKNLVWDEDDQEWSDGDIYDPKSGNTYSLTCKMKDKNTLELRGYIGISLLGRTDYWTRVEEDK